MPVMQFIFLYFVTTFAQTKHQMPASFYEQNIRSGLRNKRKLSVFLDELVRKYLKRAETIAITYIFCDDDYLLQINQQYLEHDTFTDIITFDMSGSKTDLTGEIYISADRVKENAAKFETTYQDELHRVIFHGALHLCGFKDKTAKDRKEMRAMEDYCLEQYAKQLMK